LLKGISVSEQFYPNPHLRAMRDIDLMVEHDDLPIVESALLSLGYCRRSHNPPEFYETHHHATPLYHPQRNVWIEVHRRLFAETSPVCSDFVFGADNIKTELRASEFRGRRVQRLSDELQIVYLAAHWASDLTRIGGMTVMLDMIYLFRKNQSVRWDRILEWLEGGAASASVHLLLTYLARSRLVEVPPEVLRELRQLQRSFGRASLAAAHAMIDRYIVNGAEIGHLMNQRNFEIVWNSLLRPCRPSRRLPRLVWNLLPSRVWLRQLASHRETARPAG
jgi:hypothetical protein